MRSFEITPAAQVGGNTYYLFFGTSSKMGLRRMKDAMWKVDPASGERFRDSTLADHPVLFEREPDVTRLHEMLGEKFGRCRSPSSRRSSSRCWRRPSRTTRI